MRFHSIFHKIRAIVEKRPLWTTKSNVASRLQPQNLSKKTTASQTNFGLGPRSLGHLFHGEKAIWNSKKANETHCSFRILWWLTWIRFCYRTFTQAKRVNFAHRYLTWCRFSAVQRGKHLFFPLGISSPLNLHLVNSSP